MLKEVLAWMDTLAPFAMAFVTDDVNRDTGGEWIEVSEACKHDWISKKEQARLDKAQPEGAIRKDPHHYKNGTRNIIMPNGEIRTIAIRLIRRFALQGTTNLYQNGKTVM